MCPVRIAQQTNEAKFDSLSRLRHFLSSTMLKYAISKIELQKIKKETSRLFLLKVSRETLQAGNAFIYASFE